MSEKPNSQQNNDTVMREFLMALFRNAPENVARQWLDHYAFARQVAEASAEAKTASKSEKEYISDENFIQWLGARLQTDVFQLDKISLEQLQFQGNIPQKREQARNYTLHLIKELTATGITEEHRNYLMSLYSMAEPVLRGHITSAEIEAKLQSHHGRLVSEIQQDPVSWQEMDYYLAGKMLERLGVWAEEVKSGKEQQRNKGLRGLLAKLRR